MGITFNSVDGLVSCGTADTLFTENGAMTLAAWVFPTQDFNAGGDPRVVARGSVFIGVSQPFNLYLEVPGVSLMDAFSGANSLTQNSWQQICITWTGTTATSGVTFRVNNSPKTTTGTDGLSPTDNLGQTFCIGNRPDSTRPFSGRIDEVYWWSTVLSTTDQTILGTSRVKGIGLRIATSSLVSYWPMDDVANGSNANGITIRDRWGSNPGTATNGTSGINLTGVQFQTISYLLANDKSNPRGVVRGACRL